MWLGKMIYSFLCGKCLILAIGARNCQSIDLFFRAFSAGSARKRGENRFFRRRASEPKPGSSRRQPKVIPESSTCACAVPSRGVGTAPNVNPLFPLCPHASATSTRRKETASMTRGGKRLRCDAPRCARVRAAKVASKNHGLGLYSEDLKVFFFHFFHFFLYSFNHPFSLK